MKIDAFVAEIGSTTTVVSAFDQLESPCARFLGQGVSPTTVLEGDVLIGLNQAIANLTEQTGQLWEPKHIYATSSAAGGLKMSVHGLVYDMTVKAAKEAALGAGGNILWITAGALQAHDLDRLQTSPLNMILVAGGVDYGEAQTALENARKIASLQKNIPVIYAGNIVNQAAVKTIFATYNQQDYLFITPNVYPRIDQLQVEEVRLIIQNAFEKHITEAPGMEHIRKLVTSTIIPTPRAVLQATAFASQFYGDCVAIDVGGATTDIHSCTLGSQEIEKILIAPEPKLKRTVEGDLGIYINKDQCVQSIGKEKLASELQISLVELERLLANYPPIPTKATIPLAKRLTIEATTKALMRHVGRKLITYGPQGKIVLAEGKDLSKIQTVIGTGGALTRLPGGTAMIQTAWAKREVGALLPTDEVSIYLDHDYIMASIGILCQDYPIGCEALLKRSLERS